MSPGFCAALLPVTCYLLPDPSSPAPTAPDVKTAPKAGGTPDALPPRLDFGSDEDFQLKQAINHLKGMPVIESSKALSAQAKTQ